MLLMIKVDVTGGIFTYWDVNNIYGWAMSKNLPVNNFESIEDTSQLNENFIRN